MPLTGQPESWGPNDCFNAACSISAMRLKRPFEELAVLLGRPKLSIGLTSHEELVEVGERHGGIAMLLRRHLREREIAGGLIRCGALDGDICLLSPIKLGYRAADGFIYYAEQWGLSYWDGRDPKYWWKFASIN